MIQRTVHLTAVVFAVKSDNSSEVVPLAVMLNSPRVRFGSLAAVVVTAFILLSLYYFGIFDSGASVADG
jgi:hypothetical protein